LIYNGDIFKNPLQLNSGESKIKKEEKVGKNSNFDGLLMGIVIGIGLCCLFVISSYLIFHEDIETRKWEQELDEQNRGYIKIMKEKITSLKGRELLLMRDGSLLLVQGLYNRRSGISFKKTTREKKIHKSLNSKFFYNVTKVLKPDDPDYPEMAKKFLLQK